MTERTPRTELRILHITRPEDDPIAAAWNGKVVMVTGWWLSWLMVGWDMNGERVFKPLWKARVLECPDRMFSELQLLRIM